MTEEELYDVNGGISNTAFGLLINGALIVTGAALSFSSAQASALIAKGVRFFKGILNKAVGVMAEIINNVAVYFGVCLFGTQTALATLIIGALGLSPGMLFATAIDYIQEGRVDGHVRL